MRLLSLEISGFKSFAKKSNLSFNAPITSVVGPNGSGKSNVAEAFRFVLGEQSMKTLRSKKGEDLIYNGKTNVGRQNKAGVLVKFDNKDRDFKSIDFDEVILERVVHRDGVNEYKINNSNVRLKDITELLAGANIGSTGHHIISQGEADRILNANPKDRRSMLEDSLGLRSLYFKKNESEKRLKKTEDNIREINLQKKEIAPHLKFLKKQVEKVSKAKELQDQLIKKYKNYFAREKIYIDYEKNKIDENLDPFIKEKEEMQKELDSKRIYLKREREKIGNEEREKISDYKQILNNLNLDKQNLSRKIGQLEGEIRSFDRLISLEDDKEGKKEKLISLEKIKDISDFVHKIDGENEDLNYLQDSIKQIKDKFFDCLGNYEEVKNNKTDESIIKFEKEKEFLKEEIEKTEQEINSISEKSNFNETEILRLEKILEDKQRELVNSERSVLELGSKIKDLDNDIYKLEDAKRVLIRDTGRFEEEMHEAMVLAGRDSVHYEDVDVNKDEVISEDRVKQEERRIELEKKKIRLEEMGGGSASQDIIKEYEETNERDQFLSRELKDLEDSSKSLYKLISELEHEMNKRFKEGIKIINTNFQKYFENMFGGGTASLELIKTESKSNKKNLLNLSDITKDVDEEEGVEEGVEIEVSLPRKKVRGLMMLSGGERALTSIALIFAMSAVTPPPFIILDETDAALDEANSKKYGDMIEELAKHSQLIVITHNRETMSRASTLYGVTMLQGSSELLSIKFEDGVQYAK